jgi:hypothetical protein
MTLQGKDLVTQRNKTLDTVRNIMLRKGKSSAFVGLSIRIKDLLAFFAL